MRMAADPGLVVLLGVFVICVSTASCEASVVLHSA